MYKYNIKHVMIHIYTFTYAMIPKSIVLFAYVKGNPK